jgi:acetylglutamate kinase
MSARISSAGPSVVLKVGGRELLPGPELDRVVRFVGALARAGAPPVLVHGGGDEITDRARALGLAVTRVRGQRVTSLPMLDVAIEVLAGRIGTRLVAALSAQGIPATGMTGAAGRTLWVTPAGSPPGSLGRVGQPRRTDPRLLSTLRGAGFVPVVAPIGIGSGGKLYNVNADTAAGALAGALGAHLLLLTDVEGVRDAAGAPIAELSRAEARRLLARGVAVDGMVPKLEGGLEALAAGAASVWIGRPEALDPADPVRPRGGTRLGAGPASVPLLAPPVAVGRGG